MGQTVIRVDAQDTWQQTRTAAQRVPSTVTEVTVAQVRASGPISVGDTAAVNSDACETVSLVIGSRTTVVLGDAAQFATQVRALATVSASTPAGR